MKRNYKVFSCEPQQVEINVIVSGKSVKALVPAVIAQLTPAEENGSGTMKVTVDEEHLSMFKVGTTMTLEFSSAE